MFRPIIQIIVIFSLVLLYSCEKKDEIIGACEISNEARNHFQYDAASLALEYMYENPSPDTAEIEIPQQYLDPFMNALGMLYDLQDIPYHDSLLLIHCYSNDTYGALFSFNDQEQWIINWLEGIFPTGNKEADSLITRYNLTAEVLNLSNYLSVSSNRPLNIRRLIAAFKELPGIEYGFPNTYFNFSSKLEGDLQGNNVYLRFYLGYGNCYGGCMGYNYWDYHIDLTTCMAQFLGMNNK